MTTPTPVPQHIHDALDELAAEIQYDADHAEIDIDLAARCLWVIERTERTLAKRREWMAAETEKARAKMERCHAIVEHIGRRLREEADISSIDCGPRLLKIAKARPKTMRDDDALLAWMADDERDALSDDHYRVTRSPDWRAIMDEVVWEKNTPHLKTTGEEIPAGALTRERPASPFTVSYKMPSTIEKEEDR
jgi:hypothetical protein